MSTAQETILDHYLRLAKNWSESPDAIQKQAVTNGDLAVLIAATQIEVAIKNVAIRLPGR